VDKKAYTSLFMKRQIYNFFKHLGVEKTDFTEYLVLLVLNVILKRSVQQYQLSQGVFKSSSLSGRLKAFQRFLDRFHLLVDAFTQELIEHFCRKQTTKKEWTVVIDTTRTCYGEVILQAILLVGRKRYSPLHQVVLGKQKKGHFKARDLESFFKTLAKRYPDKKITLVLDNEFASVECFNLYEHLKFIYVARVKSSICVRIHHQRSFTPIKCIGKFVKVIEHLFYTRSNPIKVRQMVRIHTKKDSFFVASNSDATPEQITALYKKRYKIERFFKTLKSQGIGLNTSRAKTSKSILFILNLVLIAFLILSLISKNISKKDLKQILPNPHFKNHDWCVIAVKYIQYKLFNNLLLIS